LTLGIFWKRANKWGASLGMMAGLGISFYYMLKTHPWMYGLFHEGSLTPEILKANTWWDIAPISAGIFGVPLGFAVIIIVSLLTKAPDQEVQDLVENVRFPSFDGSTSQGSAAH
jgi:cation/acetate symporter